MDTTESLRTELDALQKMRENIKVLEEAAEQKYQALKERIRKIGERVSRSQDARKLMKNQKNLQVLVDQLKIYEKFFPEKRIGYQKQPKQTSSLEEHQELQLPEEFWSEFWSPWEGDVQAESKASSSNCGGVKDSISRNIKREREEEEVEVPSKALKADPSKDKKILKKEIDLNIEVKKEEQSPKKKKAKKEQKKTEDKTPRMRKKYMKNDQNKKYVKKDQKKKKGLKKDTKVLTWPSCKFCHDTTRMFTTEAGLQHHVRIKHKKESHLKC